MRNLLTIFFLTVIIVTSDNYGYSQIVTWTGTTDTDWHKACNWDSNTIPVCTDNVVIPNTTNKPIVTDIAHCNTITINTDAGADVVVNSSGGGVLHISSINSCTGTPTNNGGCIPPGPNCGTQEWSTANLNVGTMINSTGGGQLQTNNGSVEKYCYNNTPANCTTYGGLYEWGEAMGYAASANCDPCGGSGVQGICPAGYHIPTDLEWSRYEYCVENNIAPTGSTTLATFQTTNYTWRGSTSGGVGPSSKLKTNSGWDGNNNSGFTALPVGNRHASDGTFGNLSTNAYYWTATESGALAFVRVLQSGREDIFRSPTQKAIGFSVRCLKD